MLLNTELLNTALLNGGLTTEIGYSPDLVVFEGFSMSDGVYMICTKLIDSGPKREITKSSIPRDDGEFIDGDYYRGRDITEYGVVVAESKEALNVYLDTIRKNIRTSEGALDITLPGLDARRYVATLANFDELFATREHYHISFCPFVARFTCGYPFGRDRDYTSSSFGFTTSPHTEAITIGGSAKARPIITLSFTAASSVTVVNVKRVDAEGTTLEEIEYSGSMAAGDILEFDSEETEVRLNATEVDYTGGFPRLEVGENLVVITVTGTSFDCYGTVKYRTTYL